MIAELETIEEQILMAVRDRLINKVGTLVENRIYLMEEAPIDCEYPYLLINDGGIDFPTPDKQGQLQVIPDFYVEIYAFQTTYHGEDPTTSAGGRIGLARLLGACLVALYKKDAELGLKTHYIVPIQVTRSAYYQEDGMDMDKMAKSKGLRLLLRKRINTAA